jgi:hypothetical protein
MADEEEVRTEPSPLASGASVAITGRVDPEPKWLRERLARAVAKGRSEAFGDLGVVDENDLAAAREAVLSSRARRRSPEELASLAKEQEDRINDLVATNRRNTLAQGLFDAMHAHEDRFIDPQAVALEFTDPRRPDRIGLDDSGQVAVFKAGKPTKISPSEFVAKWLEDPRNHHQQRPLAPGGGAGSRTAISGPEREGAPRGGVHDPYMTKRSEAARKAFVEAMRK